MKNIDYKLANKEETLFSSISGYSKIKNYIPFNKGRKSLFNVCNEMKIACIVKNN